MKERNGGRTINKQIVEELKRDYSLQLWKGLVSKDLQPEVVRGNLYVTRIKKKIYKLSEVKNK